VVKTIVKIQIERNEERAANEERAKAVAELRTKFETMLDEKKITPAVDIKWREAPIGGVDFPVEKDLFALCAAAATLPPPAKPTNTRRRSVQAAPSQGSAPPPSKSGRFAALARSVTTMLSLQRDAQTAEVEPFDLASWDESLSPLPRLAAALIPMVEGMPAENAPFDAMAKSELLSALKACCN